MRRRFAVPFSSAALALSVFSPAAYSSCAGPQISLSRGATRVGDNAYRVAPGASITLHVTNLSKGCQDTGRTGCSAPKPAEPASNVPVTIQQGNRSWTLGTVSGHGDDRSDTLAATVPTELSTGTATLRIDVERLTLTVT